MSKYTVTQVSKMIGISHTTVRTYTADLKPVLSRSANPRLGKTRKYTEEDVIVLHTAKVLRSDGMSWEEVILSIQGGEMILPNNQVPPPPKQQEEKEDVAVDLIPTSALDKFIQSYTTQIDEIKVERDNYRNRWEQEIEKRGTAEKRAVSAETERDLARATNSRQWRLIWVIAGVCAVAVIWAVAATLIQFLGG